MDASVLVRKPNTTEYSDLGKKKFSVLPRVDEFISLESEGKKYFQVITVHHVSGADGAIQIYAVEAAPPWVAKQGRTIGFGS
ncbi:MAG: hypothetical protein WEB30_10325 [Cyclobacteriaceae bacterium]